MTDTDERLEELYARVLYLEGMVGALIALHPRSRELLDFTPEIVSYAQRGLAEAKKAGNNAEIARLTIWSNWFEKLPYEVADNVGTAEQTLNPSPS